jgi:hypothetical protein
MGFRCPSAVTGSMGNHQSAKLKFVGIEFSQELACLTQDSPSVFQNIRLHPPNVAASLSPKEITRKDHSTLRQINGLSKLKP